MCAACFSRATVTERTNTDPEDKTQYATPPPPTMKIPSTHSRYECSVTPQSAPPFKGLRAKADTTYDYDSDTREAPRANRASMLSFFNNDNLAQLAQEHAAREEAMHALVSQAHICAYLRVWDVSDGLHSTINWRRARRTYLGCPGCSRNVTTNSPRGRLL